MLCGPWTNVNLVYLKWNDPTLDIHKTTIETLDINQLPNIELTKRIRILHPL